MRRKSKQENDQEKPMTRITIAAAILAASLVSAPAMAGVQDDVNLCIEALEQQAPYSVTDFRFRGVSGASVKTITFEARSDSEDRYVDCEVRRGRILDIVWQ
ncbi:MAG: hypothetical protein AAFW81_06915 [Pseudomonadota bacterium]